MNHDTIKRTHGQILILFGLFIFVIVGAMALALDVGYLLSERRQAQSAADAAALAGARRMLSGSDTAFIAQDAFDYIEANDVSLAADSEASAAVDIDGDYRSGTVTVDLTVPVTRFFVGALYLGPWEVSAHSVAQVFHDQDGEYALIALEPPGMYVNGNITVDVIGGSAMSNGDVARSGGANAFTVDGTIDAVGYVDPNNHWEAPGGFHSLWGEILDPLAGALPPNGPSLTEIESDDLPDCWSGDCVLSPGFYQGLGKIKIKKTAHLLPGTYYFSGTSLELNNTQSRIEGDDVMLYFDGPPGSTYFDPKNGEVDLVAPAASPYAGGPDGVVVWIANCTEFDSQGNQEFYIEGIFYAPCSNVWMHGNPAGVAVNGQVIVGTLDIRGTSDFVVLYRDLVETPRLDLYLVE